ncbi:MAG: enoyl-CoA hydratase/isomerase family protein [Alphaproteobacteria bacterium]|jgi:enoyl-CoA hydratase/carnithine racemase
MAYDYVSIERHGGVAVVAFQREDGVNALSMKLARELTATAHGLYDDLSTHAIVLVGRGKGFCAGRDLRDPEIAARTAGPMLARRHLGGDGWRLCKAWEELEQFTIAAIEGFAIGGGLAFALATDWRVMGAGAHFRAPEVALGLSMSWGSIPRLVNLVGPARTKQVLMMANDGIDAGHALAWGLAQDVVPDGSAEEAAIVWAQKVAAMPPVAARMTKKTINAYSNALSSLAVHMDTEEVILTETTDDHAEGVSAFLGRRAPRFTGA